MSKDLFRTCPETGLQYHKPAEMLMKAHAVVAVVILLIGGIAALLVTLTRWPAIHLLPASEPLAEVDHAVALVPIVSLAPRYSMRTAVPAGRPMATIGVW